MRASRSNGGSAAMSVAHASDAAIGEMSATPSVGCARAARSSGAKLRSSGAKTPTNPVKQQHENAASAHAAVTSPIHLRMFLLLMVALSEDRATLALRLRATQACPSHIAEAGVAWSGFTRSR